MGAIEGPLIPEPLGVKLVAIADVHLPAPTGVERELDAFYVNVLRFLRDKADLQDDQLVYHAENHSLVFQLEEAPVPHDNLAPTGIEITSLESTVLTLLEQEIPYERMRPVDPGDDYLLLKDPAGNWITLVQRRGLM